jgi:hypothetical protein
MADKPEKRRGGRPATGQDPAVAVRLSPAKRKEIEAWAAAQSGKPSFSEAVRRLIDAGLDALAKRAVSPRKKART